MSMWWRPSNAPHSAAIPSTEGYHRRRHFADREVITSKMAAPLAFSVSCQVSDRSAGSFCRLAAPEAKPAAGGDSLSISTDGNLSAFVKKIGKERLTRGAFWKSIEAVDSAGWKVAARAVPVGGVVRGRLTRPGGGA